MTIAFTGRMVIFAATAFIALSSIAMAGDRRLDLYNMNTREHISVTYKRGETWDEEALGKLDWFMRDWRRNKAIKMDRRLYDLVWEIRKQAGTNAPVHVHSGYRSQATNSLLRSKSGAVAKHSQHIKGTALDFHIPGVPVKELRNIALRLQDGGVGYYPRANNPFVHIDVADVRHWPRMSRKQLSSVFPNGMTIHIPSDGKPLKGFKEALSILAKGGRPATSRSPSENAAAVLAGLDTSLVPIPASRPDLSPEKGISVPAKAFASLGLPLPDDTDISMSSYFPPMTGDKAKIDLFLEPRLTAPKDMAIIRRPLASPTEAMPKSHRIQPSPVLVDMGVGRKQDRLVKQDTVDGQNVSVRWKFGGML